MQRLKFHAFAHLTFFALSIVVAAEATVLAEDPDQQAQADFFEAKVRPLLIKHCYKCHSAESEELKGGLALDTRQGWEQGGDSGPAIEPGEAEDSLFMQALRYDGFEMPPSGKLSAAEIGVFEKWIETGAYDPREASVEATPPPHDTEIDFNSAREFWSFQTPQSHDPPKVADSDWPLTNVDRFILAKLEAAELAPAANADRTTWLRRVSYDLTGLPPTNEQLEAFLADDSDQAHARVVDRLLASPRFGEHWGRHWLDVARYADSNGSDFNATFFNAWRYRNYVIDAFNNDKPFDQFLREQIAGDLLDYETDAARAEGLIATSFLMIGPKMLSERDKEKLTMDVVDEQIDTVGRAFMGLTLGCARCHDHKFDPIPTKDYYALAGIFRSTITLEGESQEFVSAWKEVDLPIDPAVREAWESHQTEVKAAGAAIADAKKQLAVAEKKLKDLAEKTPGILIDDQQAEKIGKWKDSTYSPTFVGKGYIHDEKTGQGTKSVIFKAELPADGKYEVRIAYQGSTGRADNVPVTITHADGKEEVIVDQTKPAPIDKIYKSLGEFNFITKAPAVVTISNTGTTGYVIVDAVQFIPLNKPEVAEVADEEAEKLKAAREAMVAAANAEIAKVKELLASNEAAKKKLDEDAPEPPPQAMAVRERSKIEDCAVCIRGEVHRRGEVVERGFVRVVSAGESHRVQAEDRSGRAELARWMADGSHPLTSRVAVNRIWHHLFGRGLVSSVDNFGKLGQRPSHAELLDTLAVEFVNEGWSVKQMIRRLALSRTYRMASTYDEAAHTADPDNTLLWRASRKRLPAEAIRDSLLVAAGKLDLTRGESPVKGMGRLAIDNSNQDISGANAPSLKRSVYMAIVRNDLPELLTIFDFADPDLVVGNRPVTNVPAQALLMLNSPFVRQIANDTVKLASESATDEASRVEALYGRILSRGPTEKEAQRALSYIEEQGNDEAWVKLAQALFGSSEFRLLD